MGGKSLKVGDIITIRVPDEKSSAQRRNSSSESEGKHDFIC